MFYIKWIVGSFLTPIPLMLLFILIAFVLILKNRKKMGGTLFVFTLFTFYLLSLKPVAFLMLEPLEFAHPAYNNQAVDFIHVLGNGHIEDESLPITSQLTYISTVRMSEAVRVYYQNPQAKLILTGYAGANTEIPTAKMHEKLALSLGVPKQNIIINEKPRDTQEESIIVKSIVGNQQVAVITTANHMRRAMGFYDLADVNAIPAPTMHLSRQGYKMKFTDLYPHAEFLRMSQFAFHEWLGILYQKIQ